MTQRSFVHNHSREVASSLPKHCASSHALDTVYIGLAVVLPKELRALCSCAGLTFAQIVSEQDERVHLAVAALPRYLSAERETYERHVREVTVSYEQFDQLLEYNRQLAAKPTCDLRDLVTEHATESWHRGARARVLTKEAEATTMTVTPVVSEATTFSSVSPEPPQSPKQKAERSHRQHLSSQAGTYTEAATVMIPTETIKVIYDMQDYHGRPPSERLLLLRAALAAAEDTAKEEVLRRVLVLRDRLRPFVELTPVYGRGRTQSTVVGFSARIDVLQEIA